eukprot:SAG31_NODE_135_length_23206_cov_25.707967_24_plen_43_part_00
MRPQLFVNAACYAYVPELRPQIYSLLYSAQLYTYAVPVRLSG